MTLPHRLYLAARWGRRDELQRYAAQLHAQGYQIMSRWLTEAPAYPDDGTTLAPAVLLAQVAETCEADVLAADTLLAFTERPDSPYGRGGRHVEWGIARQARKRLLVVGPVENAFYSTAHAVYDTWTACLTALTQAQEVPTP